MQTANGFITPDFRSKVLLINVTQSSVSRTKNIDLEIDSLRTGLLLVVLGQFSFIATITSLVFTARHRKFDESMEEGAYNLGASRVRVIRTNNLPYLKPAMIASGIVTFLVSFENFNTTLLLLGSESLLTITMYDRMAKVGSTPVFECSVVFFSLLVQEYWHYFLFWSSGTSRRNRESVKLIAL